ncbi:transporter associated domain-containing protein, partial [Pantoea septica]|uniref:transporter associated domain-containing protein n=1 Tax=Pantoea septica TaxID=472695 RepID=UPI0028A6E470
VAQGLITPLDVLEAIAGEFPDEDETPDIIADGDGWIVKGGTDLHSLQQLFDVNDLVDPDEDHASLAGLLIGQKGQLPLPGEVIDLPPLHFTILQATDYRVDLVRVTKDKPHEDEEEEQ